LLKTTNTYSKHVLFYDNFENRIDIHDMTRLSKSVFTLEIFPKISWSSWCLCAFSLFNIFLFFGRANCVGSFALPSCIFDLTLITIIYSMGQRCNPSSGRICICTSYVFTIYEILIGCFTRNDSGPSKSSSNVKTSQSKTFSHLAYGRSVPSIAEFKTNHSPSLQGPCLNKG